MNQYPLTRRTPQSRPKAAALAAVILFAVPYVSFAQSDLRLQEAARRGDRAAIQTLLKAGVDVNTPSPDGGTPLHWAVERDDLEAVGLLLSAGADVKAANRYGVTPLIVACTNGSAAMVERLLKAGADANTALPEGETALMTAARTGKVEAVKLLLAHGANVNAKETWRGQTALMWAAAENHPAVIRTLVEVGADLRARSNGGFTPFLFAVRGGRREAVRTLLDLGADLKEAIQPPAGMAPTERGAGPGGGGSAPLTPAQVSNTGLGGRAVQPAALGYGRGTGGAGTSALLMAIVNAHFEIAASLLDRGADPNVNSTGWTALHQLAWTRRPPIQHGLPPAVPSGELDSLELARKLLDLGADPNARMIREPSDGARNILSRIGSTPFLQAAKLGDLALMRLLLEYGADASITTSDGATPLMAAAGVGIWQIGENAGSNEDVFEAVKICFEAGNDVNAVDGNGYTALHGAAHRGANDIVRFLVQKGAKLDVVNTIGWTPWLIADGVFYPNTYNRRLDTAALLLELGADPKAGKRRLEDLPPR